MRRIITAALASFVVLAPVATVTLPAQASELAAAYNQQTDAQFRSGMQMRLAWTGDYTGAFDGIVGPTTLRAVRDFQARNGLAADGVMTEAFLETLVDSSDRALNTVGFAWTNDAVTGTRIGLPSRLVQPVGETEVGTMWRAADGSVEIETVRFTEEGYSLADIFDVLREPAATKSIETAEITGDMFTISGVEDGRKFFIRFEGRGSDLRGFSLAYAPALAPAVEPYLVVASNSFVAFNQDVAPADDFGPMAGLSRDERFALAFTNTGVSNASYGSADAAESLGEKPSFDASGTGFVVADGGWVLTNAHVTNACKTVLVGDHGPAAEVIVDEENDLALVRVEADLADPLPITVGKPRLGEDILALGYPLRSILADSLNVTRGNISSLLGLMNDPNYLQISAAVQPGNSGGPVVDLAGRVVGVVTAKLNAVAVADLTGDIPQSINFAIRPDAAVRFLEANEIAFETADESLELSSVPDATESVQDSILPILCLGAS